MDARPPLPLADSIASAQAWWREAGVDLAYHDDPCAWLAPLQVPAASAAEPTPAPEKATAAPTRQRVGGDPAAWPADLAAFHLWWLEEPSLDAGGLHGRVAPRGPAEAQLMIVVPMPEPDDAETLLSGAHGRLLTSMVRAMGLAPEEVYVAAALPRHMALPAWAELAVNGLGEVLRHHIALAAPERLMVLGSDVLSLLRHDLAQAAPALNEIEIQGRQLPSLSSYAPGRLLDHARLRADLWRRWLEWTDGTVA
jgi:DNA polymerase